MFNSSAINSHTEWESHLVPHFVVWTDESEPRGWWKAIFYDVRFDGRMWRQIALIYDFCVFIYLYNSRNSYHLRASRPHFFSQTLVNKLAHSCRFCSQNVLFYCFFFDLFLSIRIINEMEQRRQANFNEFSCGYVFVRLATNIRTTSNVQCIEELIRKTKDTDKR